VSERSSQKDPGRRPPWRHISTELQVGAAFGCSDFMQNESVFHPSITQCANVTYLTIVRNPFQRILSHMSHWNVTVERLIDTLTGNFTPATPKVWQQQVRGCTHVVFLEPGHFRLDPERCGLAAAWNFQQRVHTILSRAGGLPASHRGGQHLASGAFTKPPSEVTVSVAPLYRVSG
jgi:hypothetical protein